MISVYYCKRIQTKTSKGKERTHSQIPGENRYKLPGDPPPVTSRGMHLLFLNMISDNTRKLVPKGKLS